MRRIWIHALVFLAVSGAARVPTQAGDWTGNANFVLGSKQLDDFWEPNESQAELGAEVSWGQRQWPVHIATDLFASSDDSQGLEVETSELAIGVRKVWEVGIVRPYVGGGLVFVSLEGKAGGFSIVDERSAGAWLGGGVFWRLGRRFNLGLAARHSRAEIDFFGVDEEAGGDHFGFVLGWGWPASQ